MAMTFRAFCDIADWDQIDHKKVSVNAKPLSTDNKQPVTIQNPIDKEHQIGMNLHYNIQIHLPETTNMAVYDAIFQSLKKHLM